jgi:hypothetical protein
VNLFPENNNCPPSMGAQYSVVDIFVIYNVLLREKKNNASTGMRYGIHEMELKGIPVVSRKFDILFLVGIIRKLGSFYTFFILSVF